MNSQRREISIPKFAGGAHKERNSNIELLRIIAMLLIVAHHYVVNSGVKTLDTYYSFSANTIYLQLFGMWGKTAINVFILISGFFLCEMRLTWQRWFKVYLEARAYRYTIFLVLLIFGYEQLTPTGLFKVVFENWKNVNAIFTSSFLFFYMLVPFVNLLLKNISKRNLLLLIGILLTYFSLFGTFLNAKYVFTESSWYVVLYLVAAYIKKYPPDWMKSFKTSLLGLIVCMVLGGTSVVVFLFLRVTFGIEAGYYLVHDSNKIFAFLVSLFAFLTFNNMKPRSNRVINAIASTTFGVLCIHASGDGMRVLLWRDIVNVCGAFYYAFWQLILHSCISVLAVFSSCSVIDYIRIRLIEKPLFRLLNKRTMSWKPDDKNRIKQLLAMYNHIENT